MIAYYKLSSYWEARGTGEYIIIQKVLSSWNDKAYAQELANRVIYSLGIAEETAVSARIPAPGRECGEMDGEDGSQEGFWRSLSSLEMGQELQAESRCREESSSAGEFSRS